MLGSDDARGSSCTGCRLQAQGGELCDPPETPCPPFNLPEPPWASHPPAAVDEEGLGALDLGRPLAPIPLARTPILLGGLPEAALLSTPLHGIICGERRGLVPCVGPGSLGGPWPGVGTPTGHHTGLHVGSHPWHPPRGVFLVPRQAGTPSPGGLAEPQVSQFPQSHPGVGDWSITPMASTVRYETPKNPPHPQWDPPHISTEGLGALGDAG